MRALLWGLLAAVWLISPASAQAPGEARFREIFKTLVETDTSFPGGDCTLAAQRMADWMKAQGFPATQLQILVPDGQPKAGNLVAVYPGRDPKAKAVLLLGHLDVVAARREDWVRDPFRLQEEGGIFYARGVADMKAQDTIWADTLVRYHDEKFRPRRTIRMALTCGEEGGFVNGARWLAETHRDLIDAGLALNEGGFIQADGKGGLLNQGVEAAQKVSANFTLETTNPGGHSARPRPDNAIASLARAVDKVSRYSFPVQMIDANRAYFSQMAPVVGGEAGRAMAAIVANPRDEVAARVISRSPEWNAALRTTCVVTLIEGGHASNALPQSARATINCRAIPGVSLDEVQATLARVIDDPEVKVTSAFRPFPAIAPAPLGDRVLDPVRQASAEVWPGLPVVPVLMTAGSDSMHMLRAGVPAFGVSGLVRDPDGNGLHGLNERLSVKSVMDARRFVYRLVKLYADQKD